MQGKSSHYHHDHYIDVCGNWSVEDMATSACNNAET